VSRAVFLDRDGVLVRDSGYVHRVQDLQLLPGAVEGLLALQQAGYLLVVVTNQSGIARGLYTEADYQCFTSAMRSALQQSGVELTDVLHCPHLPNAAVARFAVECSCRKPSPGMLLRAIAEFGIDPGRSMMVGDRDSDLQAGRAAGVRHNFLIGEPGSSSTQKPDGIFSNLSELSTYLLGLQNHEH
jgi:D-glycero-D-manno-heptose 1,7-bisphosphate phosphatase